MVQTPDRPSSTSNLNEGARAALATVNVQLPATVVSYDGPTQTVTVKIVPCFRRKDPAQGNEVVCYSPPNIANVPVSFYGAGAFSITMPLAPGDSGMLQVCDRSIDEWKSTAEARTEPQDLRRHDLTDGVFLPATRSPADPIPSDGIDGTAMVIRGPEFKMGSASASDFIALSSKVESEIAAIWLKFNTHTHAYLPGPGAAAPTAVPIDISGSAGSVKSAKVKSE